MLAYRVCKIVEIKSIVPKSKIRAMLVRPADPVVPLRMRPVRARHLKTDVYKIQLLRRMLSRLLQH